MTARTLAATVPFVFLATSALAQTDFPSLSDPTKDVARTYGVLHPERGFSMRWTFYIDKDGKIAHIDKAVRPTTSAEDMAARLGEIGTSKR